MWGDPINEEREMEEFRAKERAKALERAKLREQAQTTVVHAALLRGPRGFGLGISDEGGVTLILATQRGQRISTSRTSREREKMTL